MEKLKSYFRNLRYVPKDIRTEAKASNVRMRVLDDRSFDRKTGWHNVVLISHRVAIQTTPVKTILINKDHVPRSIEVLYRQDLEEGLKLAKQLLG